MKSNESSTQAFTTEQLLLAHDHYFDHHHQSSKIYELHQQYAMDAMGLTKGNAEWYAIWALAEIEDSDAESFEKFFKWYYENYVAPPSQPQYILIILI